VGGCASGAARHGRRSMRRKAERGRGADPSRGAGIPAGRVATHLSRDELLVIEVLELLGKLGALAAAAAATATAAGGLGVLGAHGEGDLVVVRVDGNDPALDLLSNLDDRLDVGNKLVSDLGNVDEAVGGRADVDEGAVGHDAHNLALGHLAHSVVGEGLLVLVVAAGALVGAGLVQGALLLVADLAHAGHLLLHAESAARSGGPKRGDSGGRPADGAGALLQAHGHAGGGKGRNHGCAHHHRGQSSDAAGGHAVKESARHHSI
jgi:hypothetical protein